MCVNERFTIKDFRKKYGTFSASYIVKYFVDRSPSFSNKEELACVVNEMLGDLEIALTNMGD
jgi:hypothetical protein